MRITQQQLSQFAQHSVRDTRSDLSERQQVAASGQRLVDPSDDPTGSARARLLRGLFDESNAYVENTNFGRLRLGQADQSLAEATNVLIRAKELTLAMATDTVSVTQRSLAAQEIDTLRQSLIDIANTEQNGEFIFAHVDTLSPPVDDNGAFTYDLDLHQEIRSVETGPASTAQIGASASKAFGQRAADPDSIDLFDMLEQLASDLRGAGTEQIRVHVDAIGQGIDQVVSERTEVGVRMGRVENAQIRANQAVELYRELESKIVDADAAEAFSSLQLAQTGLQASISVSARVLGPSLLDQL